MNKMELEKIFFLLVVFLLVGCGSNESRSVDSFTMVFFDPELSNDSIALECQGKKINGVYEGSYNCVSNNKVYMTGSYNDGRYDGKQLVFYEEDSLYKYYYYSDSGSLVYEKLYDKEGVVISGGASCNFEVDGTSLTVNWYHTNIDSFKLDIYLKNDDSKNPICVFSENKLYFQIELDSCATDSIDMIEVHEVNLRNNNIEAKYRQKIEL